MQSWLEDCSYMVLDFNAPGSLTTQTDRQTDLVCLGVYRVFILYLFLITISSFFFFCSIPSLTFKFPFDSLMAYLLNISPILFVNGQFGFVYFVEDSRSLSPRSGQRRWNKKEHWERKRVSVCGWGNATPKDRNLARRSTRVLLSS